MYSTDSSSIAQLTGTIAPYLNKYGYITLYLGIFLEDFGLPSPGETILIAAALSSALGDMNIWFIVPIAILAAITGDSVGYVIGYFGGTKLIEKFGKYSFLTADRFQKLQDYFSKKGGKIVIIARFIEGLRQFNGIIAGVSKMTYWKFLIYNSIGAVLWVGFWSVVAYFFGDHIDILLKLFTSFSYFVFIIIIVAIIWFLILKKHSK
jgi:membrane protein DedA with SNARE-associated domain